MHVALLGMGRLARSLAPLLEAAGHRVTRWRRGDPQPRAELCWITASDRAVAELATWLEPGPVVLHASGGLDHEVLRPHRPAGSLHPLQSFPGPELGVPQVEGVPAAIAGDPEAQLAARELAESLGMRPFPVPGDRRLYHAACVLAGNFGTVLLADAVRLLEAAGVPPEQDPLGLLVPLMQASIQAAHRVGPAAALTGPAARGDQPTIDAHLEGLARHQPELLELYRVLSERAHLLARQTAD
jgi:predicted short-subunit dehydrogenase-like oxidoreductase (DUF2520 family)